MGREEYFARRLYTQAIASPETNATEWDEIEVKVRELAEYACLDPDRMVELAEDEFIPVTTDDFDRATEIEQTMVVEK